MQSPVNRLLAALPSDEFSRVAAELEVVEVRRRDSLYSPGSAVEALWFPESGAVAIVTESADGTMLETGLIGSDGLVGLEAFFGAQTARQQALVLLPGVAHKLGREAFGRLAAPGTALHDCLRVYAWQRMMDGAQSALCDATHSIRHRCVRRLLALHDAAGSEYFPLTQQVLAGLLGVRRASVSVAAEKLQAEGLIVYEHGRMRVANRPGLEEAGCGCYRILRDHANAAIA
jgi:CRP-like cAMP-binding protein